MDLIVPECQLQRHLPLLNLLSAAQELGHLASYEGLQLGRANTGPLLNNPPARLLLRIAARFLK